jgi:hypothetical protein
MHKTWRLRLATAALAIASIWTTTTIVTAADGPRTMTRLIYQDDATHTVKWADLQQQGDQWSLSTAQEVSGFPTLLAEKQSLVQMEHARGMVLVGVRDDENGTLGSGWVLIDTGVDDEEHGDHSHWTYPRTPRVLATVIDQQQGNPAHLYCYEQVFYLANDKKNGFTRLDPAGLKPTDPVETIIQRGVFHPGGGGHITLAAAGGMAYSSWIDREGEHRGRVDLTPLSPTETPQIACSITLPSGGIHGATAAADKVFFAPTDGICWVGCVSSVPSSSAHLAVKHISLGKAGEQPRRTGSFTTWGRHVAFVTGAGALAQLSVLDAAESDPQPTHLAIPMQDGSRPSGLKVFQPRKGSPLAAIFTGYPAGNTAQNQMLLVELDPNTDGLFTDARVLQTRAVGPAQVDGHGGHHSLTVDADRRRIIYTNPGSGQVHVLAMDDRRTLGEFTVGGVPSKLLAIGGRASSD